MSEKTTGQNEKVEDAPVIEATPTEDGLKFWCVYCKKTHYHSRAEGHRAAHCVSDASPYRKTGYILRLPEALRPTFEMYDMQELIAAGDEQDDLDGIKNIKIDRDSKTVDLNFDGCQYSIPMNRLRSAVHLLSWVVHLSEKNWMNAHRIRSLIVAVCKLRGWDPHGA
jgi:hypothetical protein